MTAHCATCNCSDDATPPQPSASSPGIRRMALDAAAEAVRKARERRTAVTRAQEMETEK